jgi:hypothetical protein
MHTLSDAIRRGLQRSQGQAHGDYFGEKDSASALGAAVPGLGTGRRSAREEAMISLWTLGRQLPSLAWAVACPLCRAISRLDEIVELHVNDGICDRGRWAREQIVEWLKEIEDERSGNSAEQDRREVPRARAEKAI